MDRLKEIVEFVKEIGGLEWNPYIYKYVYIIYIIYIMNIYIQK